MKHIPAFPSSTPLTLSHQDTLQSIFAPLHEGIAEFTFVNLYLFRAHYDYRVSYLPEKRIAILGRDAKGSFCLLPQGLPPNTLLERIMESVDSIKCVSKEIAESEENRCTSLGLVIEEDRDNFDYLYLREELATLKGRKFHKKRNFVNYFQQTFEYSHIPLEASGIPLALKVLKQWRKEHGGDNDYDAAKEALAKMELLGMNGYLTLIAGKPCGYTMGEELAQGTMFVVHFEKATVKYRGIFQFINKAMAETLPQSIKYINREQDLGDSGLQQAKMTYRPVGFVEKYRIRKEV